MHISHGGRLSSATVVGGTWVGPRAPRPHPEGTTRVDPYMAASSSAHCDDIYGGESHGQPGHLEGGSPEWLSIDHRSHI